jgi:hypothetical protein
LHEHDTFAEVERWAGGKMYEDGARASGSNGRGGGLSMWFGEETKGTIISRPSVMKQVMWLGVKGSEEPKIN